MKDNDPRIIKFKSHKSPIGNSILSAAEEISDLPFKFTRFFYIYQLSSHERRGGHDHKTIFQGLIAINGSFNVETQNIYGVKKEFLLNDPSSCLIIPPMIWAEQFNYQNNAICFVITSGKYDENEYIRDKNQFIKL